MPNYKKLPAQSKYFNGPLYQRMLDDLHLAGMADRTIYGYIRAVRQLAEFSQLAPDQRYWAFRKLRYPRFSADSRQSQIH